MPIYDVPYRYASQNQSVDMDCSTPSVTFGEQVSCWDRFEQAIHLPGRSIMKHFRPEALTNEYRDLRQIESVELTQKYLTLNGLHDVNIDVRVYDPAEQWLRLRANTRVSPVWKYTGGLVNWVGYSILPGRVLHTDRYNVFTNTLTINSKKPTNALFTAAEAKIYDKSFWPGAYWALQRAPFVPVAHDMLAGYDVVRYSKEQESDEFTRRLRLRAWWKISFTAARETASEFIEW